jgi:hypothetical protein
MRHSGFRIADILHDPLRSPEMKRLSRSLAFGLLILVTAVSLPVFARQKGGIDGGGDGASQDLRAVLQTLPETLKAKGLAYFPEVSLAKLMVEIQNPKLHIEEESPILVDGVSKDARNFPDLKLIRVDPVFWWSYSPLRRAALAFHEILGIMRLEGNDEYHISSRLLLSFPPPGLDHPATSVGRYVAADFNSTETILVSTQDDGRKVFSYCANRNDSTSCRMLGARAYAVDELTRLQNRLMASAEKSLRDGKKVAFAITGLGAVVGGAVGAIFGPGTIPFGAGVGAVVSQAPAWLGIYPDFQRAAQRQYESAFTLSDDAIAGRTAIVSGSLYDLAMKLHQVLISLR